MPEIDSVYLLQQQELLKEIRDELKAQRAQSSAAVGGAGGGGAPRPGNTYAHFQAANDRLLMGEWNSLGWNSAYKHLYSSSYTGDLMGTIGLNRAPEIMTQTEYQATARQALGFRAANLFNGMIAPGFTAATNELTQSIFANSQRFIRPGNPLANGITGSGFNFNTASQIASGVNTLAFQDSRLSHADYNNILETGMASNQFNNVSSVDDFLKRTKELADATASLTRTLHMSVGEITQTMGSLRTMGIEGPGRQAGVLRQMGAFATVAGMTAQEMINFAQPFAQGQMGSGMTADASMALVAQQVATLRVAGGQGLISANMMAQGGGPLQMAANIASAQNRFATSMPGYLSILGGGGQAGANGINSMFGGLAQYRSPNDMLGMDYDRFRQFENMSPGQAAAASANAFQNQVFAPMKMLGIDPMSDAGRGYTFSNLQRNFGMDSATANAWIISNETIAGRRSADNAQMQASRQQQAAIMRDHDDEYYARFSLPGRIHAGVQAFGAMVATGTNWVSSVGNSFGAQNVDQQMANLGSYAAGVGTDGMSLGARAHAMGLRHGGQRSQLVMPNTSSDLAIGALYNVMAYGGGAAGISAAAGWGLTGLGAAMAGVGAGFGGIAGAGAVAAIGGIATVAAPLLLAGAVIAGGAALAYSTLGGATTSFDVSQHNDVTGTGANGAQTIRSVGHLAAAVQYADAKSGTAKLRQLGDAGQHLSGWAWEKLRAMSTNASDGMDTAKMADYAQRVVGQNKGMNLSVQDVVNMKTALSGNIALAPMFKIGDNNFYASGDGKTAIKNVLGESWMTGNSRVGSANLAASSGLMSKYIDSVLKGKGAAGDAETAELRAVMDPGSFEAFKANIERQYGKGNTAMLKQAAMGFQSTDDAVKVTMLDSDESSAKSFLLDRAVSSDVSNEDKAYIDASFADMKHGDLYKALEGGDKRIQSLALSGKLGETAKQAASVASNSELVKMNVNDFNKKYGLNVSAEEWKKDVATAGKDGTLQDSVVSTILNGSGAQAEQASSNSAEGLLKTTAQILQQIEKNMHGSPAKNPAGARV